MIDSDLKSTKSTPFSRPPRTPKRMTPTDRENDRIYEPGTFTLLTAKVICRAFEVDSIPKKR